MVFNSGIYTDYTNYCVYTDESTPKWSTYCHISKWVLPFEVISVCCLVRNRIGPTCWNQIDVCPRCKSHLKLPQQIALTNLSIQANAIVRVLIVTQVWCNFFMPSTFLLMAKRPSYTGVETKDDWYETEESSLSSYPKEKHLFTNFSNECFCLRKPYRTTILS